MNVVNSMSTSTPPGYELTEEMELATVRQILADPTLLPRLAKHLTPSRFEVPMAQLCTRLALGYWKRFSSVPTRVALIQEAKALTSQGQTVDALDVADYIERASAASPLESRYVLDRIMGVERREATFAAIEESTKAYRRGDYDVFLKKAEEAHAVGRVDDAPGMDFRKTLLARSARRRMGPPPLWGIGVPEIDDLIRGLDIGELGCVMAKTGGGKSIYLGHVALYVMATSGFCVYFTTEISENLITDRQDAAISKISIPELHRNVDLVEDRVSCWFDKVKGGLIVKKVPKYSTSRDLETYLDGIRIEHGAEPDVVVVDYADEMNPNDSSKYDKRHEELVAVHEELRDLAERRRTRVWTASQVTLTEALEKRNPTMSDMAGARGKAFKDDVIVAICQSAEEAQDGYARFFVAKGRNCRGGVQTDPIPTGYVIGRLTLACPWLEV